MSTHAQAAAKKVQRKQTKNNGGGSKKKTIPVQRVSKTVNKAQKAKVKATRGPKRGKTVYGKRDLRNVKTTHSMSNNLTMSNSNPAITIEVPIRLESLQGISASVVCAALRRGFADSDYNPDYPYMSYVYLTEVLVNYSLNAVPKAVSYPYWLVLIGQSLTKKTVSSYSGKISYKFKFDGQFDAGSLSWKFPLGPQAYSRNLNFGVRTSAYVNNSFCLIEPPSQYTPDKGEEAWQALLQYLQRDSRNDGMHRMISSTSDVVTSKDASAYAVVLSSPGAGNDVGGWFNTLLSEIPIKTPVLSKFAKPPTGAIFDVTRGAKSLRAFSGDSFSVAGFMIDFLSDKSLHFKSPPIFKAIDFMEFLEVYLLWLKSCSQTALNSLEAQVATSVNLTESLEKYKIDLTIQEIALLLRATLMNAFKDTQHFAQSVYPQTVNDGQQNAFVPFIAGVGMGARPGTTGLLLPLALKENILALTRVWNSKGRGGDTNPQFWIPVLGKYYQDRLDESDYTIQIPTSENPITISLFKSASEEFYKPSVTLKRSLSKGKLDLAAETEINLVDGAVSSGYVAMSYPGSLNNLIDLLNNHIRTKLANYSMPLCTLGTDGGINAVRSIAMSRMFVTDSIRRQEFADRRFVKAHLSNTLSPYENRIVQLVSSFDPFIAGPWEQIQEFWVLPTVQLNSIGNDVGRSIYSDRIRAISCENHCVDYQNPSSMSVGLTLLSLHNRFADRMVRTDKSRPDDLESFFKDCEAKGDGGILSSLVGNAVSSLFPKAKPFVDMIANVVPV